MAEPDHAPRGFNDYTCLVKYPCIFVSGGGADDVPAARRPFSFTGRPTSRPPPLNRLRFILSVRSVSSKGIFFDYEAAVPSSVARLFGVECHALCLVAVRLRNDSPNLNAPVIPFLASHAWQQKQRRSGCVLFFGHETFIPDCRAS